MTQVIAEQSISLDGYSAGANDGPANPLGDNGQRLHEWLFADSNGQDAGVTGAYWSRVGAVILGKRMFDNGLESWNRENPWDIPGFVLTRERDGPLTKNSDIQFTFVSDGLEGALAQARDVAGDKDVAIAGGANTIGQFIQAGFLDEIHLHIVPIFLGGGVRFFDQTWSERVGLEPVRAFGSSSVTHLEYRITR